MNNEALPKLAKDKQARIGCKGKNPFWYACKQNVSVDMQTGLINKVAIPDVSVIDSKAMKQVLPDQGPCMRIEVIAIRMQEKLVQKKASI